MKRALVTGVSSGIGHAVATALLEDGWHVTGISRTPVIIGAAVARKQRASSWVGLDISDSTHPGWLTFCERGRRPVDALVHCAGIRGPYGPLAENDPDEWARTIATNLLGTYHVVRAALPALRRSEDGRILLFSGGGAFSPEPGYSAYAASKGATISLMETLAEELRGSTVTANAVAPGFVATDIHKGTPLEGKSDGGDALGRAVACVRHLLSPDARGLTGKTVSAGWDPWGSISPETVPYFNDSDIWTRSRIKAQAVPCPVGVPS